MLDRQALLEDVVYHYYKRLGDESRCASTDLTVGLNVKREAGVNAGEFRKQNIIGEVDQVLEWIHVRVVDKMLTLT